MAVMNFATIIFILYFGNAITLSTATKEPMGCKNIESQSTIVRLKKYLLCNYDWSVRNGPHYNDTVNVTVIFAPKLANFDEHLSNLELDTWIFITWQDVRLSWEPSSYEKIRDINMSTREIWVPDIAVETSGNYDENESRLPHVPCVVSSDGQVGCVIPVRHVIRCQTDFTHWPYDRQNCTLILASPSDHAGQQIAFVQGKHSNRTVFMEQFVPGEWTVTVSRVSIHQMQGNHIPHLSSPNKLSIDFILDRVHGQHTGRYVTSGIIMAIMTLTTLWLDPRSSERLAVGCLNPIIHLLCLENLNWSLPHNGDTVPSILLFYINSYVLAFIALFLTFTLAKMREIKGSVPQWLNSWTTSILRSRMGQIFLLGVLDPKAATRIEPDIEDNCDPIDSGYNEPAWGYVVLILSWILFFVFFLTYTIMWAVLIPNSSMRPPLIDFGLF